MNQNPTGFVPNGSTETYTLTMSNTSTTPPSTTACDADAITITFYCPGADGRPDLANPISVTSGFSAPSESTHAFPSIGCLINVNTGVTTATAQADFNGTVHTSPLADDVVSGSKTITVATLGPTATVTPTPTNTPTSTNTVPPTVTPTVAPTLTPTSTATQTPTVNLTPTVTPPSTNTPTATASPTQTPTNTATPRSTSSMTPTITPAGGGGGGLTNDVPALSPMMLVLLGLVLTAAGLLSLRQS